MTSSNRPLQQKLINVIMLISGAVTLVTCLAFFIYDVISFRQTMLRQLAVMGEIISANSTAALAFGDQEAANETLSVIEADRHVEAAALYDKDNALFSTYPSADSSGVPTQPPPQGYRFEGGHLIGVQRIVQGDDELGTLYLRSDIQEIYDRFKLYAFIATFIIATAFLLTYVLSKGLQQKVSKPILALAETAKVVSRDHDYSIRAKKLSEDEVGSLTDAFNQMLTRIEQQSIQVSESEERLRSVLNSAMTAVIVIDAQGTILDWNARAEKMFGWSRNEVLGQDMANIIIPEHLRESHWKGISNHNATGSAKVLDQLLEMEALHRSGRIFPIELSISKVRSNDTITFCGFITDITERKRAEEEIMLFNQRLEQMVQERTIELQLVNKELESFSYSVSHDLRAPLRAIHGYMSIFADEYSNKFDDEARRLTTIIMNNTQKMGRLIDDLLAFSQLGRKELIKTYASMAQIVENICDEQKRLEDKRDIEFIIDDLPYAFVDTVTIRQVWVNLISNAVKYTRHKPKAEILIGARIEGGEQIYFVKDNGAGFDMTYYDKLFGVFQRLHSQKEFEGTGVGLAIVQRIVSRHGGRVWAEGALNEGATFYFALKRDPIASPFERQAKR